MAKEDGIYAMKFASQQMLIDKLQQENEQLKDKLSKIETLIINHNCDTGDIYYKYNSKFLKSELKQRILEIVYEEESDNLRCEKEQFESMEYKLGD